MLMLDFFKLSIPYVMGDEFFILSMACTTAVALFIGATIYDGLLREVKKGIVTVGSYALMLVMANYSRVTSVLNEVPELSRHQPFAGIVTILFVTFFYITGMLLGVWIVSMAQHDRHSTT